MAPGSLIAQTPPAALPAEPPPEFTACAQCHQTSADAPPSIGPNLFNVIGRKAGSTDFAYSEAMKSSGLTWTPESLQAYILAPAKVVPGNMMDFGGTTETAAKAIVAYLQGLKDR